MQKMSRKDWQEQSHQCHGIMNSRWHTLPSTCCSGHWVQWQVGEATRQAGRRKKQGVINPIHVCNKSSISQGAMWFTIMETEISVNGKILIPLTERKTETKKLRKKNLKRKLINLTMSTFVSIVFPFHAILQVLCNVIQYEIDNWCKLVLVSSF